LRKKQIISQVKAFRQMTVGDMRLIMVGICINHPSVVIVKALVRNKRYAGEREGE